MSLVARYLEEVVEVGEKKGNPRHFDGIINGATLEKICVWVRGQKVKGLNVSLTDGQTKLFGSKEGKMNVFTFKDGEHFSSLSLWESDAEKRVGAIQFQTNHSRKFSAGKTTKQHEVPVDVASGICLGIIVHSGKGVYCLGFEFISNIESVELTKVQYPTLLRVVPKVNVKEIKSMTYQNNTSETQEYKIETSKKMAKSSSWSLMYKLDSTFSVIVSAGIPKVMSVDGRYEVRPGCEERIARENTEDKMELFSFPVKVPKGKAMDVCITIGQVTIDFPFTGTVRVCCYNNSVLEFQTKGMYKGVMYTEAKVVVTESDKKLA